MKDRLKKLLSVIKEIGADSLGAVRIPALLIIAVDFAVFGLIVMLLYYAGKIQSDWLAGYTWIGSLLFLAASFLSPDRTFFRKKSTWANSGILFFAGLTVIYFFLHMYNRSGAPWNSYGLFDDGAWDIFDAQLKCLNSDNFEIIFFDEIGFISRELLFHYYIMGFMKIFGYSMTAFNASLAVLGFITVLFTAMTVRDLTESRVYGFVAGVILMFWPIQFTQTYMGHRYAICGPCVAVSVYFLQKAFRNAKKIAAVSAVKKGKEEEKKEETEHVPEKAEKREKGLVGLYAALGGIFAGFAMESAIMGKQYIWALLASAIVYCALALIGRKFTGLLREKLPVTVITAVSYFFATIPLYAYRWSNSDVYNARESGLLQEFFSRFKQEGMSVAFEKLAGIRDVLFAQSCGNRQFSADFPALTIIMAILLGIGLVAAVYHKRVLPLLLTAIPMAGNCVTICYDFRILLAVPYACILMVEGIRFLAESVKKINKKIPSAPFAFLLMILVLIQPIGYIRKLANDPYGQRLLPHQSVAVSRYMQDVASGVSAPDFGPNYNELKGAEYTDEYDFFGATFLSYAHVHAFLGTQYSRYVLSLIGDFPYVSTDPEEIRRDVVNTLTTYAPDGDRDLVIAIEFNEKARFVTDAMEESGCGTVFWDRGTVDDTELTVFRIRVPKEEIPEFVERTVEKLN